MANNRIYLRCKGCGDTLFLGKTYTHGYYWDPYGGKPLEDRLNEFYDKHNYCTNQKAERTPYSEYLFPLPDGFDGCDGAFDIVYENNEGTGIEGPVDVVPVVHGEWTIDGINEYELSYGCIGYEPRYRCSRCGITTESYLRTEKPIMPEDADFPNYCPNCGAKMGGERKDGERDERTY